MFGPPAYPSQPPPPPDKVRPMSLFGAALWITGTHLVLLWLFQLVIWLREAAETDPLTLVACQMAAYSAALFLILRVHAPDASIRNFVALRPSHFGFYPLAAVAGVAASMPAQWLFELVERRWPEPEGTNELFEHFSQASRAGQAGFVVAMVLLGPVVEEMLFRGAVFGPLLRERKPSFVIVASAVFFALVHPSPPTMLPIFMMGLMLGYFRAASGSLGPAVLLHASFNAVPFAAMLAQGAPSNAEEAPLPVVWIAAGSALTVLALGAAHLIARASRVAAKARARDEA